MCIRDSLSSFSLCSSFFHRLSLPQSLMASAYGMLTESLRRAYGELTENIFISFKTMFSVRPPSTAAYGCLTQDCHAQFLTPAYGEPYGLLRQVLCLRRLTAHLTDPYGFPNASSFLTRFLLTAAYGAPYGPLRFSQRQCVFNYGVAYGGLRLSLIHI